LFRLHSEFIESGHESAVSHRSGETVTTPWSSVSGNAAAGVALHIIGASFALPAKAMDTSTAESSRGAFRSHRSSCGPPLGGRALLCGQLK
jgi:hypothetical protein